MATRHITIPYTPRPLQAYLHDNLKRFNLFVCHRRFGKSVFAINHLIKAMFSVSLERPRVAYIGPTYAQTERVIWDYAKYYTKPIPNIKVNNSKLRIDFPNEARLELISADNPDSSRGAYFDFCILDEYGEMNPQIWSSVLRPALSDRNGGAIFIGTPKGQNDFYRLYEAAQGKADWFTKIYRASQTGIIAPDELESARQDMSEEEYEQEFECSFSAAIRGAYYARALSKIEDQITDIPIINGVKVDTAWDLGMHDDTVIWFSQALPNGEVRLVDYYHNNGEPIEHYVKVLQKKGYTYGTHWAPHDIEVREMGTGKSRRQVAYNLGLNFEVVAKHSVQDGIEVVRNLIPRCWFDREKCQVGIDALRQYRQEWKPKEKVYVNRPLHDWASHPADAFRYLAMGMPMTSNVPQQNKYRQRRPGVSSWAY